MGKSNPGARTLESILGGGLYNGPKKTVGGRLLNSLGIESTLYDSSRSSDYFSGEAWKFLGEAETISTHLNDATEAMKGTVAILQSVRKQYGLENLNPVTVAMEAANGNFFQKLTQGAIAIFQRLVLSVANFVKQIQVWIAGPIAKAQAELYNSCKPRLGELLTKFGNNTVVAARPKVKIADFVATINKGTADAIVGADEIYRSLEAAANGGEPTSADSVDSIVTKISSGFTKIGVQANGKLLPSRDIVLAAVYDSAPASIAINKLFGLVDFAELGTIGFARVREYVNQGKRQSAALGKALGNIKSISSKLQNQAGDATGTLNRANGLSAEYRKVYQFVVNMLLTSFSIYMRHRGYLYTSLRTLLQSEKAAATPATATP